MKIIHKLKHAIKFLKNLNDKNSRPAGSDAVPCRQPTPELSPAQDSPSPRLYCKNNIPLEASTPVPTHPRERTPPTQINTTPTPATGVSQTPSLSSSRQQHNGSPLPPVIIPVKASPRPLRGRRTQRELSFTQPHTPGPVLGSELCVHQSQQIRAKEIFGKKPLGLGAYSGQCARV